MKKVHLLTTFGAALLLSVSVSAKEGIIQCANLIYGGSHTSRCFSDEFLSEVQRKTTITTERRFKAVKLDSEELFKFPFVIITGEEDFILSTKERANLKSYLEKGGFLLASSGCSSKKFGDAFVREMRSTLPDQKLTDIPKDHAVFSTVNKITEANLSKSSGTATLKGLEMNGKLAVIFSPHGLNDTSHTEGCCCCGGNEISNAMLINMNIFVYALIY